MIAKLQMKATVLMLMEQDFDSPNIWHLTARIWRPPGFSKGFLLHTVDL